MCLERSGELPAGDAMLKPHWGAPTGMSALRRRLLISGVHVNFSNTNSLHHALAFFVEVLGTLRLRDAPHTYYLLPSLLGSMRQRDHVRATMQAFKMKDKNPNKPTTNFQGWFLVCRAAGTHCLFPGRHSHALAVSMSRCLARNLPSSTGLPLEAIEISKIHQPPVPHCGIQKDREHHDMVGSQCSILGGRALGFDVH